MRSPVVATAPGARILEEAQSGGERIAAATEPEDGFVGKNPRTTRWNCRSPPRTKIVCSREG